MITTSKGKSFEHLDFLWMIELIWIFMYTRFPYEFTPSSST